MNAQLTAAVVHDIKNRLVILSDELARLSALPLGEAAQRHAAAANTQSMLLSRKLVEFLTVQKAGESGLHASTHEECPQLFLEEIHADALPLTAGRVELVTEIDGVADLWFFDRQLVRLALDSALHNALRFASSRITLGACMRDGDLCFYVRDDGPGVQDEACATSTGLGRLVCDEVAQAHKNKGRRGRSALRNHAGGGAVYELCLP